MAAPRLYVPARPSVATPEALARYLFEELGRISLAFDSTRSNLMLDELNVEPSRPVEGLVAVADGTNWNPGSGQGAYIYLSGVWIPLGAAGIVFSRSVNSVSTNGTNGSAASTDYVYLCSSTITRTMPTAVGNTNRYTIKNVGAGVITVATTGGQTIDGAATATLSTTYESIDLVSDGSNWNII